MGEQVTIKMVADHASVSVATVSYVLSGLRPVSDEKKDRVRASVSALGYSPNQIAKSLRTQHTAMIAIVVPDITNPFYPAIARSILDDLDEAGFDGIICCSDGDPEKEARIIEKMVLRRVDGIAVCSYRHDPSTLEAARRAGIPTVFLGNAGAADGDSVVLDSVGGSQAATEHLLALGHRSIVFLTGTSDTDATADRLRGYETAVHGSIEELSTRIIRTSISQEGGREGVRQILGSGNLPDAIVCANDQMAISAMSELTRAGIRVPQDISVVGFDDIEAAAVVTPSLTTVSNPAPKIGAAMAETLLGRIDGSVTGGPRRIELAVTLMQRDSTRRTTG
ncbi:LacI family DNA-binding transcriptional regulator [Salinibacterium sp. G-O1]|uniref:LacI family DNA-binding transcriptional regulator n=1 Tax=Salinibacterium sp. G-O1 TaxID=3046208 RepID=UPI0024B98C5B|nr:LacI family DNA-binding transcriptional regulator [Salinibacterium sp. G-O1]MDJ0334920.1 LacI family DNA-binding transcriptional regulator [Salinibacterium sp. G-O1]